MKIRPIEFVLFVVVLFCALIMLGADGAMKVRAIALGDNASAAAAAIASIPSTVSPATTDLQDRAFADIDLQAKAAYVYDVKDGKVLYAQNENEVLPLASITKLMTALVSTGVLPPSTIIPITAQALAEEDDNGLYLNEKWRLGDLLKFTLTVSSNDGAHAIAAAAGSLFSTSTGLATIDSVNSIDPSSASALGTASSTDAQNISQFVAQMNDEARQLSLPSMQFYNTTGLDLSTTTSGAYGSAKDVAGLFQYIMENQSGILNDTTNDRVTVTSLSGFTHTVQNTNLDIDTLPDLIGSKTGNTDLAGGNLVVGLDIGIDHPVIICVLGSTVSGRFTDISALASSTLAYFSGIIKQ